jgi:hypothetical protein
MTDVKSVDRTKLKKEALKLVRVVVSSRDPKKKNITGEIIAVGNDYIGMVRKYVPFDNQEGWHVPEIIVKHLENAKCQIFYNVRSKNRGAFDGSVRKAKEIKAYTVERLKPLTKKELEDLAKEQKNIPNDD